MKEQEVIKSKLSKEVNELIYSFLNIGFSYSEALLCSRISCELLIKEHTLKEPSKYNVERHNHFVNVLIELNK